jgi:Phage capsid family
MGRKGAHRDLCGTLVITAAENGFLSRLVRQDLAGFFLPGGFLLFGLAHSCPWKWPQIAQKGRWAAENALIPRSSPSFDQVLLSPKRLGTVTAFARTLLAQSTLDIQNIVTDDILKVIAIAQDAAFFNGSAPTNNMPLGLFALTANAAGNASIISVLPQHGPSFAACLLPPAHYLNKG